MNIDEQRLRAAMDAVDPIGADEAFARRAALEGSRRTRRNRTLTLVGGLSAVAVVAALTTPLWLPDRGPATVATPSPVPTVTETPTPSATAAPTPSATPSGTPSAGLSGGPSATASGSPGPVASDRLITSEGIGALRVGMTMEEGKRLGIATDKSTDCGPWDMTPEGRQRYPGVWAYWNSRGLINVSVGAAADWRDETSRPGLAYATADGLRAGDAMAEVTRVYGTRAIEWKSDSKHWAYIDDLTLPAGKVKGYQPPDWELDGLLVRDGDRALVFLGRDGTIEDILVTTFDSDGKTMVQFGC